MALIQLSMLARLRYRDDDGAEATCQANLPAATDPASALGFLSAWRGVVGALSAAVCIEADLVLRWSEVTPAAASSSSDSSRQGAFIFATPSLDFATVRVPSIDESLLDASGPYANLRIDPTLAVVIAFVEALATGIAGIESCDPFSNDLVELAQAYKQQF